MALNQAVGSSRRENRSEKAADPDAVALGEAIRSRRLEAGLTLEQVANVAGVSRSLVSQVERGQASPSITTLRGIASALGVPIGALFHGDGMTADPEAPDSDRRGRRLVVRRGDRKRLQVKRSGVYYELLTPDVNRKIEFLHGRFAPGASAPPEPGTWVAHQGEENVVCLEGTMTFVVDGKEFVLEPGDSISFDCSIPHRAENRSDTEAVLIVAITPPSF